MKKQKIIIDCAPGRDQAIALAYAAAKKEELEILAITTVSENKKLGEVTENVLALEAFLGLEAPVAAGLDAPLVREPVQPVGIFGDAGFAGALDSGSFGDGGRSAEEKEAGDNTRREARPGLEEEQGILFLHRILSELPEGEKATVVALSSLTNLAVLLRLFPHVKEKLREIVFAGGAARGGNVTPCAEYHIYADPEAAKIVFHAGVPLVMCGLDASLKCTLTRRQILKLCQSGSPAARLCGDLAGRSLENSSDKYRGETSIYGAVPLMYLLHPEFFVIERTILDVDCSCGEARGATLCDFRWWEHEEEDLDAFILMDADPAGFQEELITALYELGEELKKR